MSSTKNETTLGERVRNKRLSMGKPLSKLSQETGLSVGHISEIENGIKENLQHKTLIKLSKGLDMRLMELLGEKE